MPPPTNNRELQEAFNCWNMEGYWLFQAHAIKGLDDDDEQEMAYHIFDDVFAQKHPECVAWLMLDGWQLPSPERSEATSETTTDSFTPAFRTKEMEDLSPRGW